ncbi:MAG: chloride channel protein [Rhizobacter sp.]|nr:chloride channel protein [Bacteriovorax sp.]
MNKFLKFFFLSVLTGIFAGITSSIFLHLLKWATDFRIQYMSIIWCLPVAGLAVGILYHLYGREASRGNNLILEEIHDPKKILPLAMAPLVLLGTLLTHLFGGSAGREGTAVQMSASIADNLGKFFKVDADERKILLMAGAGAGFSSAIGAPIAGFIFGMEVITIGKIRFNSWPQCLVAAFTGYYTSLFLKIPHSQYPEVEIPGLKINILFAVMIAGLIFGLTALLFSRFTHLIEHTTKRFIKTPYFIPFVAGFVIVGLYYLEGSYRYAGLGIEYIQESLTTVSSFKDPLYKTFFSALTVGSGFKGGEFVPLVFIGATLGSALSLILPAAFPFLSALGFASVFAGASNTPLACAFMAAEIFGWKILPYSLLACYLSYYSSGHSGIYHAQNIYRPKHHLLFSLRDFLQRK